MTSITSALTNYYQLSGQTGGQTSTNTASTTATQSLADILAQSDNGDDGSNSSDSSAYLMDLSPAAQAYLNANSNSATTAASSSTNSTNFTLTSSQQTQITNILAKYKNAPYTQATFNSIQNDLSNAGLGTSQLSSEDQVSSFNATDVLIGDLDGNTNPVTSATSASDEQTKSTNYMQSIMSQWQSVSTTYSASAASGTSAVS